MSNTFTFPVQAPEPPKNLVNPTGAPPKATFGAPVAAPAPKHPSESNWLTGSPEDLAKRRKWYADYANQSGLTAAESQVAGENQYWDSLWKTNPGEVWKAAPRTAALYAAHDAVAHVASGILSIPAAATLGVPISAKQQQKAEEFVFGKNPAEGAADIVLPKPHEALLKTGVPPIPGAGFLGEAELPSQVLMGAEEEVPANLKNITPVQETAPAASPAQGLKQLEGAVPAKNEPHPVSVEFDHQGNIVAADGRHRVVAALQRGDKTIPVRTRLADGTVQTLNLPPKTVADKMGVTPSSLANNDDQQSAFLKSNLPTSQKVTVNGKEYVIPAERTTGNADLDKTIRAGGGIPGGVQPKVGKMDHDLIYFHDPKTGTSLNLPENEITPETIGKKLSESRARYAAAEAKTHPLAALPGTVPIKTNAANEKLLHAVNQFQRRNNRASLQPTGHVSLDDQLAKDTADYYQLAGHNPHDLDVQNSYNHLKRDIEQQYYFARAQGVDMEPWTKEGEPYANSADMMDDVRKNKHLYFYTGGNLPADHPMAERDSATGLSYNDMFRAVHDLFGHAAEGHEFGPTGERRAFLAHAQMMHPASVPALAFETHGQNSWVNFGPHMRDAEGNLIQKGQPGYLSQPERPYAEQKANILPSDFHRLEDLELGTMAHKLATRMKTESAGGIDPVTGKSDTEGIGTEIFPESKQRYSHKPTAADIEHFYDINRDLMEKYPDLRLGWDLDPNKGWELNLGAVGPNAEAVAKKLDQRAAFDIGKGELIPTGGANEKTQFPGYSLKQRLSELKGVPVEEELEIPSAYRDFLTTQGHSWRSVRHHEAGHAVIGASRGFNPRATFSHLSIFADRALANQYLDFTSLGKLGSDGSVTVSAASLKPRINDFLDTLLAGGMAEEVIDNLPFHENIGTTGDMDQVRTALHLLKLDVVEQGIAIKAAKERVKRDLTNPEVQNIIKKYSEYREAGIGKNFHSSASRNLRMAKEVKEAIQNARAKEGLTGNTPTGGENNNQGNPGNVPRGEGGPEGGSSKVNPPGVRTSVEKKARAMFPKGDASTERTFIEPDGTIRSVMDSHHYGVGSLEPYKSEGIEDEDAYRAFMDDTGWYRTGRYDGTFLLHGGDTAPTPKQLDSIMRVAKENIASIKAEYPEGQRGQIDIHILPDKHVELPIETNLGRVRRTIEEMYAPSIKVTPPTSITKASTNPWVRDAAGKWTRHPESHERTAHANMSKH